jgi:DNA repair protein RadC
MPTPEPSRIPVLSAWRPEDRPRERLLASGAAALADAELVALLLGQGRPGRTALDLARDLLVTHGGVAGLGRSSASELTAHPGVGPAKAARVLAACELGRRRELAAAPRGERILTPADAARAAAARARDSAQECFLVLLLDARHRLLRMETIGIGGWEQAAIQPREVFRPALAQAASAVIVAHNHPSGDPAPSPADLHLTRQLIEAAKCLGIRLLDHVIIGQGSFTSLRTEGHFPEPHQDDEAGVRGR